MEKKAKKTLKKAVKFAVTICTIITGAVLLNILPFDKIKEKLKLKKEGK